MSLRRIAFALDELTVVSWKTPTGSRVEQLRAPN